MRKLAALLCLLPGLAYCQSVNITRIELSGDNINVTYDLESSNAQQNFQLFLYTSKDNFAQPVTKVSGDVGSEIKPGNGKKMTWRAKEEIGAYKGKLTLEVKGRVYVPFVKLQQNELAKSYKKGKSYSIAWKPGNTDPVNIELYKGNQRILGDMNQSNDGDYNLHLPSHLKSGKDYTLRFTDSRDNSETTSTLPFAVKPKTPLLLKVAVPVIVLGGLGAVLLAPKTPAGESTKTDDGIPLPNKPN